MFPDSNYLVVGVVVLVVFLLLVCWFKMPDKSRLEQELARWGLDPSWLDSSQVAPPDSVRVESDDSVIKPESWIPPPYLAEPPSYSEAMGLEPINLPRIPQTPDMVPTEPAVIEIDPDSTLRTAPPTGVFSTEPHETPLKDIVSSPTLTAPPTGVFSTEPHETPLKDIRSSPTSDPPTGVFSTEPHEGAIKDSGICPTTTPPTDSDNSEPLSSKC